MLRLNHFLVMEGWYGHSRRSLQRAVLGPIFDYFPLLLVEEGVRRDPTILYLKICGKRRNLRVFDEIVGGV